MPGLRRHADVTVDCQCGTTVEAEDADDLLDELFAHIADEHEAGLRRTPVEMLIDAYET